MNHYNFMKIVSDVYEECGSKEETEKRADGMIDARVKQYWAKLLKIARDEYLKIDIIVKEEM